MRIDKSNINNLYSDFANIHDAIFKGIEMNYGDKSIKASMLSYYNSERIFVFFHNVIGFDMTLCDFWGRSPHVLGFKHVDESEYKIIPKIFQEIEINNYFAHSLQSKEKYIETGIELISGDCLNVACEYIEIIKTKM